MILYKACFKTKYMYVYSGEKVESRSKSQHIHTDPATRDIIFVRRNHEEKIMM